MLIEEPRFKEEFGFKGALSTNFEPVFELLSSFFSPSS